MMQGFFGGLCNDVSGNGLVSWLITIGVVAALVLVAIWLVRRFGAHAYEGPAGESVASGGSAKEILQVRYARGEIGREQF